jgi:oxygen-independent coproporphyrinogen-3 oxidase
MTPDALLRHGARNLPRYTSYPTALRLAPRGEPGPPGPYLEEVRAAAALSLYAHIPFCERLCWYCGCHTTVAPNYARVARYTDRLAAELALWAEAVGPEPPPLAHLHFGGGSPNALSPQDFLELMQAVARRFPLQAGAEIAVELDPGRLTEGFIAALGAAGVSRVSLGVQTFDPKVQAKINRIQPLAQVAEAMAGLRACGVKAINFDLMYGLPEQSALSVWESARAAAALRPQRLAVFGYAHVPWAKKHQSMIREEELGDVGARWEQACAADEALTGAGYVRIGLDHYALPDDALSIAAAAGRLRRNFQGYTADPAPVLIPLGASSIGQSPGWMVQNAARTDVWAGEIAAGRPPVTRAVRISAEDRLRATVIEQLMCALEADVGALCRAAGQPENALDACLDAAAELEADGLCRREGRLLRVPHGARLLVRAAAALFDAYLDAGPGRHAKAI